MSRRRSTLRPISGAIHRFEARVMCIVCHASSHTPEQWDRVHLAGEDRLYWRCADCARAGRMP